MTISWRAALCSSMSSPLPARSAHARYRRCQARRAATGVDQWDEPNFTRYGAALRRRFPEVNAYVFKDLAPSTGTAAVQGVATFLARLDALENGTDPGRAGTKQSDKKAVAFLATRSLDKAERKRLQGLVDVALGPTSPLPEQAELPETARRREALVKLRAWFDEWSTTARAVIKQRGTSSASASRTARRASASPPPRRPSRASPRPRHPSRHRRAKRPTRPTSA